MTTPAAPTSSESAGLVVCGRVWLFGDRVNTDELYPGFAMKLPIAEAARHMFSATRPEWVDQVQPGDLVIGGVGFGIGSSRPVPLLFKKLGVAGVFAEQFNSLFFRNCINYGLPALNAQGITALFTEGDIADIDLAAGLVRNASSGARLETEPLPEFVLDIVRAGGLRKLLRSRGMILDVRPGGTT
jgi:3-isopropylmalate/(R)-2-methylmalate dehydratase small subunit